MRVEVLGGERDRKKERQRQKEREKSRKRWSDQVVFI